MPVAYHQQLKDADNNTTTVVVDLSTNQCILINRSVQTGTLVGSGISVYQRTPMSIYTLQVFRTDTDTHTQEILPHLSHK